MKKLISIFGIIFFTFALIITSCTESQESKCCGGEKEECCSSGDTHSHEETKECCGGEKEECCSSEKGHSHEEDHSHKEEK